MSEPTISRILAAHRASAGPTAGAEGQDTDPRRAERIAGVLPVAALDERLAFVGTSGSGKTCAAKRLVERLLDGGAQVCIVDPLGVRWGLRAAADGSALAASAVVVLGGRHADVPLAPGMGGALGHLVGTQAPACVVDASDLGSATRRAFVTAFTEALCAVPGQMGWTARDGIDVPKCGS